MRRRTFLKVAVASGAALAFPAFAGSGEVTAQIEGPYGPLLDPDVNGVRLPAGFSSRIVAVSGQQVPGTTHFWHFAPDGGATFPTAGGGWTYVSNAELSSGFGGVSALEFDSAGTVIASRTICAGTSRNCAGGATPWGTWLSCEETAAGIVWECDPTGLNPQIARPAMGTFSHEATAYDPSTGWFYLTEDTGSSGLYRFRPNVPGDLSAGVLEAMTEIDGVIGWGIVTDPSGVLVPTRRQVPGLKPFGGGEGAWFDQGALWFTTKFDNKVWRYEPATESIGWIYQAPASDPLLTGVDNLAMSASGDIFVCEDGGNMELVLIAPDGLGDWNLSPFLQVTNAPGSELTGVAFDPSGTRMYFSSQRNPGVTFEITGPFRLTQPEATCDGHTITIMGTDGDDEIEGTAGDDVIAGLGGDDQIAAGPGDDVICGGTGNDTIDAGSGDDVIISGSNDDTVIAGSGADEVHGGQGNDLVDGGSGADNLSGGGESFDSVDAGSGG